MALTRHFLNSQVLVIFPPSETSPAAVHYSGFDNWPMFSTQWYVIVFYKFFAFFTIWLTFVLITFHEQHHPFSLLFTTSISIPQQHSKSYPSPNHHPSLQSLPLLQQFYQLGLRQGPNWWGSLVRTDAFLIFSCFLEAWTEINVLTITDSSSTRLRKLAYH